MQNSKFTYVQSGKFKGKKLLLPSSATTRSTKSLVQGSFFDAFRFELREKIFIEMFGGSALMAISALSNGAKFAYAIEIDKKAYEIMARNSENIERIQTLLGDSFAIAPNLVEKHENIVLYVDPPFHIRDGFANIYEKISRCILGLNAAHVDLIAIEHVSSYQMPVNLGEFNNFKSKKFGKTTLSYYAKDKARI